MAAPDWRGSLLIPDASCLFPMKDRQNSVCIFASDRGPESRDDLAAMGPSFEFQQHEKKQPAAFATCSAPLQTVTSRALGGGRSVEDASMEEAWGFRCHLLRISVAGTRAKTSRERMNPLLFV